MEPAPEKPPVGSFCWTELLSTDAAQGTAFYADLLGWTVKTVPMESAGPGGQYHLLHADGKEIAGAMALPPHAAAYGASTHWLFYLGVEDVDARAARAVELGGSVVCPCLDIPDVGRFCIIADPEGAQVALYKEAAQ
jgi:hypothetical protein